MDLEYRQSALSKEEVREFRSVGQRHKAFAANVSYGHVNIVECVKACRRIGHCIENAATGEVIGLSVDRGYRLRGVSRRILCHVVDLLRTGGATRIWLTVPPYHSSPAYRFYRASGWTSAGRYAADGNEIMELNAASERVANGPI